MPNLDYEKEIKILTQEEREKFELFMQNLPEDLSKEKSPYLKK